ncbi:MAG: hypothetical protein PHV28_18690, partial [Kiritimatiellae bacterium]|nr:hypothetical protein [Kiritimatiellia bacterium]
RLAAGLILASLAGECGTGGALAKPSAPGGRGLPRWRATSGRASRDRGFARASCILSVLTSRHCASGGFVSAPRALPDLLATAVARFSIGNQQSSIGGEREADLAFVEACWRTDGLFGASPRAGRGDAEHTFYGLLALGTCR